MLKFVRGFFDRQSPTSPQPKPSYPAAPFQLIVPGTVEFFPFAEHIQRPFGYPIVDWKAVYAWVDGQSSEQARAKAWDLSEQAWLLHLRAALGDKYTLLQSETAALISPLQDNVANATLEYMNRTLKRVTKVLDGVADFSAPGKDILIVFENEDQYYNYVSCHDSDGGEFALSSGMFIDAGCGHFVTVQSDLPRIEPVIAHEMTHAGLAHLHIPLWLNEGLAVATERRLAGVQPGQYTAREMQEKHLEFWGAEEIQEFWSGSSFRRIDDGNLLSYDLARILVENFSSDWPKFKEFVLAAQASDGGADAAQRYLGVSLGMCVAMLFDMPSFGELEPRVQPAGEDLEPSAA